MIEECPKLSGLSLLELILSKDYSSEISKMNDEYYYWDKVKYNTPKGIKKEDFWALVKYSRTANSKTYSFNTCTFSLFLTNKMQEYLHNFDMNFGGTIASSDILLDKNKQYYLLSSIMEEAIASSQMEGASTTRKVAKEMLRKQSKPKDKSQQMILNNYNTIRYLSEHKNDNLSPELLLTIHKQITEKTLDNPKDEGQFRSDNNIYVVNGITGEVAHEPPSFRQIKKVVQQLCRFINEDKEFIHPIIKAIILHFMISYLHPFVDGNGRTARSLFYWYMLKKGYWLTEYLSISRIIYKSKTQYEKAFLYTEHDDFDLGYFVHLYTDKIWFEDFIIKITNTEYIKLLDGSIVKTTPEEMLNMIYSDYTNINRQIIDDYSLDLKIFYEDFRMPETHINEIPVDKLDILINKMGLLIENSKENKPYTFDIKPVKEFIHDSAEIILKEIEKE